VLSISVSILLLTVLMTIWHSFYIDQGPPDTALRLMTRHRVSLTFLVPTYYRDKIRAVPGVTHVVPMTFYMGKYLNDRPENYFVSIGTDPSEYMEVAADKIADPEQIRAWKSDRTGALVDVHLAQKHGWKLGDRIRLTGTYFPANVDLTIRALYTIEPPNDAVYFDKRYLEEQIPWLKGQEGLLFSRVQSPEDVSRVAAAVDDMFRNSPHPTRSESEQNFRLDFLKMLGNIKAFILTISGAVTFAILLVTGNTMAMNVRERTRELAVLRTVGFTRGQIFSMLLGESLSTSLVGGAVGIAAALVLLHSIGLSRPGVPAIVHVSYSTMLLALTVSAVLGVASAMVPSLGAARKNIVDGLRYVG
jgi:putative ABC transport system permease protein